MNHVFVAAPTQHGPLIAERAVSWVVGETYCTINRPVTTASPRESLY
jgi:hypothetical protein